MTARRGTTRGRSARGRWAAALAALGLAGALAFGAARATAAEGDAAAASPDVPVEAGKAGAEASGPVTGLPLPRFVSLRAGEARARRGPSLEHRVDWLYRRRGLPLLVTAEHGHWRRVEDIEGLGGWVHYSLISGARTAIVTEDLTELLRRPDPEAPAVARLEAGVIAALGECDGAWCRLAAEGHRGWAPRAAIWGAEPGP